MLEMLVKVLLALAPTAVMAAMHTTIIRASITAYSTAVGPASRLRKLTTRLAKVGIHRSFRQAGSPPRNEGDPDSALPSHNGVAFSVKPRLRSESFGYQTHSSVPLTSGSYI